MICGISSPQAHHSSLGYCCGLTELSWNLSSNTKETGRIFLCIGMPEPDPTCLVMFDPHLLFGCTRVLVRHVCVWNMLAHIVHAPRQNYPDDMQRASFELYMSKRQPNGVPTEILFPRSAIRKKHQNLELLFSTNSTLAVKERHANSAPHMHMPWLKSAKAWIFFNVL